MKMNDFLQKLFNGMAGSVHLEGNYAHINLLIAKSLLQDNLDLLAKEMHMEVELQSTLKKKPKYRKIKLNSEELMEAIKNGKRRINKEV